MNHAQKLRQFRPTEEHFQAADNLLKAKALILTIEPIVNGYKSRILAENEFYDAYTNERILDPEHDWTMGDEQFLRYFDLVKIERDKSGLKYSNPDGCPLLDATNLLMDCDRILIEVMEPVTGISMDAILCHYDEFKNYVDLLLSIILHFKK